MPNVTKAEIKKIYVEDKLPSKSGNYLVQTELGNITTLFYSHKDKTFNAAFNIFNDPMSVEDGEVSVKWWADISMLKDINYRTLDDAVGMIGKELERLRKDYKNEQNM